MPPVTDAKPGSVLRLWFALEVLSNFRNNANVMADSVLWSYRCPAIHEGISSIIRRRSTNPVDVRDFALAGLDLTGAKKVLDVGCGFGFMAESLASRVAADACITGVDVCVSDEGAFMARVRAAGRQGDFVSMRVDTELPWPDRHFDLVACSYALYFFVDVLPDLARVLAPGGLFLAVTHSEASLRGRLPDAALADGGDTALDLTRRFSAENGWAQLSDWFGAVEQLDYSNRLVFESRHADELLAYLKFKLPLVTPGALPGGDVPDRLTRFVDEELRAHGQVVVEKNDAVFRCRDPLWR